MEVTRNQRKLLLSWNWKFYFILFLGDNKQDMKLMSFLTVLKQENPKKSVNAVPLSWNPKRFSKKMNVSKQKTTLLAKSHSCFHIGCKASSKRLSNFRYLWMIALTIFFFSKCYLSFSLKNHCSIVTFNDFLTAFQVVTSEFQVLKFCLRFNTYTHKIEATPQ